MGNAFLARSLGVVHSSFSGHEPDLRIAFTDHLADCYARYGVSSSIVRTIPPGLPRPSDRPTLNREPRKIGFVAQDFIAKGGNTLMEAWRILAPRHPEATLSIAGCAPQLDQRSSNALRITWQGRLPRGELLESFYPSIDILACPTRFDGPSLVLQEALSFGIPSVVSDYGPLPSMLG